MKVKNQNHRLECLNHGFEGLKDYTDFSSVQSKNLCHQSNPSKSVIQTKSAEILNSIFELI
jgi:hypothetical protein